MCGNFEKKTLKNYSFTAGHIVKTNVSKQQFVTFSKLFKITRIYCRISIIGTARANGKRCGAYGNGEEIHRGERTGTATVQFDIICNQFVT